MALALLTPERQAISAVLRFVNMRPRINSAAQVERCFAGAIRFRREVWTSLSFEQARVVQEKYRGFLANIAKSTRLHGFMDMAVSADLQRRVTAVFTMHRSELRSSLSFQDLAAACAYGVALILDKRRGLTSRLKQCGWCGRFNLDFEPKGRPRRFCSPEHKDLADRKTGAERTRKSRAKRQKAMKEKP